VTCRREEQTAAVRSNSDIGPDGEQQVWPSPIRAREWVDPDGSRWHMRGGTLDQRQLRRLLKRLDVRVLHVYGPEPREIAGRELGSLLAGIEEFFRGRLPLPLTFVSPTSGTWITTSWSS